MKLGGSHAREPKMPDVSRRAQLILLKNDLHIMRGRAQRLDLSDVALLISEAVLLLSNQPEVSKSDQPRA
ncbi:hypothetical protein A4A58_09645 [Tardiphaga robiniae]|jgi:hypothetical protein|uniref:Uncharacterized protein n=2 Tax=Tardiphaga robiniae TaxID=943830 RepID=A0A163YLY5_9BRAD|nr:hypothetical protein A4A58_09645 [Tardiphaga robiniae]